MSRIGIHIKIILLLLLFGAGANSFAQIKRSFEEKKLEEYKEEGVYQYGLEPQSEAEAEKRSTSGRPPTVNAGKIGKWVMYIIIGIAFVLIAVLLIRQFTSSARSNNKLIGEELIQTEEIDDLQSLNLGQKIIEAEKAKKYELAIRYQFLRALKKLDEKNAINWQKNKTDRDYYYEISDPKIMEQFDRISMIFEHVWYGKFPTNEANYRRMQIYFQLFTNMLK